ncbi:cell division protein FtsZ [Candidatus Kuenenbacteria bacterium CG_4_9_14_3_um_filter_39_14]|uniref:Cell division protein FtsZ n=5 Tax=Candidatus Kueneniibacteriota TaxID=1752740 RepID=A0A2M7ILB8_9BACT|nr:cell division protein FtsZ [Candidatus Kuenenbacteria bacterium]PIP28928.1 MAG: cell division protein FtsZ [Candidatus Kuenenbacteria bacterium CG23_combo_of_CG06-09_8_20_14_all_39_39]PIR81075.1 MAG: cell division protein FtsZ [Candidatus Kuenenbacteria bacterium CG10_big_fil_rev_8_21_14_0_10_39_14]PIW95593.1 MAG: cell division protein FtsZ [Candidatus Kuenenbacteria bacterium CG_4_8_14_3_um_filter_39_15]PJA91989.1 MAG: cell division protein FtsZ [Candidatus Kuenenbacteria bacterium CG_4_9_1
MATKKADNISKKKTIEVKPDIETFAKIKVVGVGGGGGSAINRMVASNIAGVDFISINTDAQALHQNLSKNKLHIGRTVTRGLGAGMNPELGTKSAEESSSEIREVLKGSDMIFITCGLGGGTGTGAAPVIAAVARDVGALTVAVVTRPFSFEGAQRRTIADKGLEELAGKVDTIISIPNDRILQIIDKKTSLLDAFAVVDDVLLQGVKGISELITKPGLINVDFADVKAIMKESGSALMGIGQAGGENRAVDAAKIAIDSPLLELSIEGAKGVLFTITGPSDLSMNEVNEAARLITASVDSGAKIIFGTIIDDSLKGEVAITVIATGFAEDKAKRDSKFDGLGGGSFSIRGSSPTFMPTIKKDSDQQLTSDNRDKPGKKIRVPVKDESVFSQGREDDEQDTQGELEIPAFIRRKMK